MSRSRNLFARLSFCAVFPVRVVDVGQEWHWPEFLGTTGTVTLFRGGRVLGTASWGTDVKLFARIVNTRASGTAVGDAGGGR
jgi:hypothetical protein